MFDVLNQLGQRLRKYEFSIFRNSHLLLEIGRLLLSKVLHVRLIYFHFRFRARNRGKIQTTFKISPLFNQPGVVAHACDPVTWRLGCLKGLRLGFLRAVVLCRSGVRAKFGVNMGNMEESEFSRLVKEERTGPGWKHSRQKLPRQTVVG